jgi:hypothetical protein
MLSFGETTLREVYSDASMKRKWGGIERHYTGGRKKLYLQL